ncbi:MAG: GIY-YIG nuclease family protein [Candidatus Binatia bacterium]
MAKQPAVYILASKRNGTLYIGVAGNLQKRTWEHKNDLNKGFTKQYEVHPLVYDVPIEKNSFQAVQKGLRRAARENTTG